MFLEFCLNIWIIHNKIVWNIFHVLSTQEEEQVPKKTFHSINFKKYTYFMSLNVMIFFMQKHLQIPIASDTLMFVRINDTHVWSHPNSKIYHLIVDTIDFRGERGKRKKQTNNDERQGSNGVFPEFHISLRFASEAR